VTAARARAAVAERPLTDVRRLDRVAAAVLMPVGPVAVGVLRFSVPTDPVGESVAAHPGAQRVVLWCGLTAVLTLLPGVLAAVRLLRRYTPRLATWAGALLVPGYPGLTALLAGDAVAAAGTDVGLAPAQVTALVDRVGGLPTMTVLTIVFVVGHIMGTLLLGIAVLRTRLAPAPVAVAASHFVHLGAIIAGPPWLDLLAWLATAAGMAFLARRVLATPDDAWDLPPFSR
jgi:hypothetical protein